MKKIFKMSYILLMYLMFFAFGFLAGMVYNTYTLIGHVGYALSGSTLIVNLNETNLVNEMNKTIVPQIKNLIEKDYLEHERRE